MKKLCKVDEALDRAQIVEVSAKLLRVVPEEFDREETAFAQAFTVLTLVFS